MATRLLPCKHAVDIVKSPLRGMLSPLSFNYEQVRDSSRRPNKHQHPDFANLRRLKMGTVIPMKYNKDRGQGVKDGIFQNMPNLKKVWREREIYTSCSNNSVEEFVPPENSGTAITEELKKKWSNIGSFGKDKVAIRGIRKYEPEFNVKVFAEEAKEIYVKAHECLAANDQESLNQWVTEHARLAMLLNSSKKTVRWKYLQSLEEPKVVQVRVFQLDDASNMFSQATVRLFSQQSLAIYDRFGRLIYGSEILAKDVLEYVVFEKHLSNEYGLWRLHAKIIPDDRIQMAEQTFVVTREPPQEPSAVVTEAKDATASTNTTT